MTKPSRYYLDTAEVEFDQAYAAAIGGADWTIGDRLELVKAAAAVAQASALVCLAELAVNELGQDTSRIADALVQIAMDLNQ